MRMTVCHGLAEQVTAGKRTSPVAGGKTTIEDDVHARRPQRRQNPHQQAAFHDADGDRCHIRHEKPYLTEAEVLAELNARDLPPQTLFQLRYHEVPDEDFDPYDEDGDKVVDLQPLKPKTDGSGSDSRSARTD
jgi:hypothetical protein